MRRFQFKLEAVLKHRQTLENLRLQAFAGVHQELAACDARIAVLRAERRGTLDAWPKQVDTQEIERRERYLITLEFQAEQAERVREGILARLNEARAALMAARQARESIARARERAHEAHQRLADKAEQDIVDEIAVLRHSRSPFGER